MGPGRRRAAVIHGMRVFKISKRLAFLLVVLTRPSFRRPLNRDTVDDPDKALKAWPRAYERRHPRWGDRGGYVEARNDGWVSDLLTIIKAVALGMRGRLISSSAPPSSVNQCKSCIPSMNTPNQRWVRKFNPPPPQRTSLMSSCPPRRTR